MDADEKTTRSRSPSKACEFAWCATPFLIHQEPGPMHSHTNLQVRGPDVWCVRGRVDNGV